MSKLSEQGGMELGWGKPSMIVGIVLTLVGIVIIAMGEPVLETRVRMVEIWTVDVQVIPPGNYSRTVFYSVGSANLQLTPEQREAEASLALNSSQVPRPECKDEPIELSLIAEGVYKEPPEGQDALQVNLTLSLEPAAGGEQRVFNAVIVLPPPPENLTPRSTVVLEDFKAYASIQPTIEYGSNGKVLDTYTKLFIEPLGEDLPTLPPGEYTGVLEARLNGTGLLMRAFIDARVKCTYIEQVTETQTETHVRPQTLRIPVTTGIDTKLQKIGIAIALLGNLIVLAGAHTRRQ